MKKTYLVLAALLGFLGVVAGALGAHALRHVLEGSSLQAYRTAVLYQMMHVLAILMLPALPLTAKAKNRTAFLFLAGIFLFSGSIYWRTTTDYFPNKLIYLTPTGGLLLMAGWLFLAWSILRKKQS